MSKTWDEKHARNKGKAKDAFEQEAPKKEPDLSTAMKAALDGVSNRRKGTPDRRKADIHKQVRGGDDGRALSALTGSAKREAAKGDGPEKPDEKVEKRRPAPPPPQLNMGGMSIKPMPRQHASTQEQEQARERMRAQLAASKARDARSNERE